MKYFLYFLAVVALFGLDAGLFSFWPALGAVPNLLLLFLIVTALDKSSYDFFFVAVVGGLLLDFNTGIFFGSFSFSFLGLGLLLHLLAHKILLAEANWKQVILILVAAVVGLNFFLWAYYLLAFKAGWTSANLAFSFSWQRLVAEFFYNLLLYYPLYKFAEYFKAWTHKFEWRHRQAS